MPKNLFLVGLFLGLFVTVLQAQSTDPDLTQGIQLKTTPLSMGGAYRAIADTNDAILLNPAGLGFHKENIAVAGAYSRAEASDSHVFSASAIDAKTLPSLPLGISYDRDNPSTGTYDLTVNQLSLAGAAKWGSAFSVGMTFKGYYTTTTSPLVTGPRGVDTDLGLLFKASDLLSFALTAQNLFNGHRFEEFPFTLGAGTLLNLAPVAKLSVDVTHDFQTQSSGKTNSYFGTELRMAEGIFFRGGFGIDQVRQNNFYSLGLALVGPKMNLTFAYSQRLSPSSNVFSGGLEFYL